MSGIACRCLDGVLVGVDWCGFVIGGLEATLFLSVDASGRGGVAGFPGLPGTDTAPMIGGGAGRADFLDCEPRYRRERLR